MVSWRRRVTRYQWIVLLVAWLGWVFDSMDATIYALVLHPSLEDLLHVSGPSSSLTETIGSYGGVIFGVFDWVGRWRHTVRDTCRSLWPYEDVDCHDSSLCHVYRNGSTVPGVVALSHLSLFDRVGYRGRMGRGRGRPSQKPGRKRNARRPPESYSPRGLSDSFWLLC